MCKIINHRHSIFCVLPPHILHSIVNNGTSLQRECAIRTLVSDNTFRAIRAAQPQVQKKKAVAAVSELIEGQKNRTIYNSKSSQNLPGDVIRTEGSKETGDPAVDEAYDGLGATYDFFWDTYLRNSIDDEGLLLKATVHFGREYNNAFWNGEQMVFGDGDGEIFNRFTISLDVIAHELTHGVTEDEAQLYYFQQSGALNESMSDVFGSLVKQYILKQTAEQADWLIGAGLFTPSIKGTALRSMKAPGTAYDDPVLGKDPQPGDMKHFVRTFEDNGGVHINSGIPNRAFYLIAKAIGGYAWEEAGTIWYDTLRDSKLKPTTGFQKFANLTYANAIKRYGITNIEAKAVKDGWSQVGIKVK